MPSQFRPSFCRLASTAVALSALGAAQAGGAPGAWSYYTSAPFGSGTSLALSPNGTTLWVGSTTAPGGASSTELLPRLAFAPTDSPSSFSEFENAGLDNAQHDNILNYVFVNKLGDPVICAGHRDPLPGHSIYDRAPYLFFYDKAALSWKTATVPPNEDQSWDGGPINMVRDDNGDLLACGGNAMLQSADGAVWTVRADLRKFLYAPPPYQPGYGNNSLPAWVKLSGYGDNVPVLNSSGFEWVSGLARMPWGELLVGGESSCYLHSLDNGATWEWFDPLMNLPQRDMQGYPMYRNPAAMRLNQLYHAVATKDGEVMFNCKNNGGHHFFIWSAAGHQIEASQGLPGYGAPPGICMQFVTLPASGDTFMSTKWMNVSSFNPSPTGHECDVFKWDGQSWSIVTEGSLGWFVSLPNDILTDGQKVYVAGRDTGGIYAWTPDLSGGIPPKVSIVGGTSATGAPSASMDAATGWASVALQASASGQNALTYQWNARGPAPVTFEDANALSPRAWFSAPGDYVLNLQASDAATHLRAGASVIVHVRPAPGGSAPAVTAQPQNQTLVSNGQATFTVQAAGSGPIRYQWKKNGVDIVSASAQTPSLTLTAKNADDGSAYHCVVMSPFGRAVSHCAVLGRTPAIVAAPVNQVVAAGGYATFSVAASGTQPLQWQWLKDGAPIPGATQASFAANIPGAYSVTVTNIFGSATSDAATLANGTPPPSYTLNIIPGASTSNSGGETAAAGGAVISSVRPVGTPAPIGVERDPAYDFDSTFQSWNLSGLPAGAGFSFSPNPASPQASFTLTGAAAAGATITLSAAYKDSNALPYFYLNVVNGLGTGRTRQAVGPISPPLPVMNIAASPAPPGFVFDRWTGAPVADAASAQTTVTLANPQTTVTARYIRPFARWQQLKFGANAGNAAVAGDAADPDGDGIANLVEYALGMDPIAPSSAGLPTAGLAASAGFLSLTFSRPLDAADATYTVQAASDPAGPWTDGSRYSALEGDLPSTSVTAEVSRVVSGGTETITVRDLAPLTQTSRRFLRLKVSRP